MLQLHVWEFLAVVTGCTFLRYCLGVDTSSEAWIAGCYWIGGTLVGSVFTILKYHAMRRQNHDI